MTTEQQFIFTIISIVIATISLIGSCISVFFQFFHKPRRLFVISMPMRNNGNTLRFGICNGGKVNAFISGLSIDYSWELDNGCRCSIPVGNISGKQRMLMPGDIGEFSIDLKPPPKEHLEGVPPSKSEHGEIKRVLDIFAHVQFAFPDGDIYLNDFALGQYEVYEEISSTGLNLYDLNKDLMKNSDKKEKVRMK